MDAPADLGGVYGMKLLPKPLASDDGEIGDGDDERRGNADVLAFGSGSVGAKLESELPLVPWAAGEVDARPFDDDVDRACAKRAWA